MATKRSADSVPDEPQEKAPKLDEEDQEPSDEVTVEKNGTLESTAPDIVVDEPADDPPNEDEEEEKREIEEEEESESAPDLPDDVKEESDFKMPKLPERLSPEEESEEVNGEKSE